MPFNASSLKLIARAEPAGSLIELRDASIIVRYRSVDGDAPLGQLIGEPQLPTPVIESVVCQRGRKLLDKSRWAVAVLATVRSNVGDDDFPAARWSTQYVLGLTFSGEGLRNQALDDREDPATIRNLYDAFLDHERISINLNMGNVLPKPGEEKDFETPVDYRLITPLVVDLSYTLEFPPVVENVVPESE